MLGLAERLRPRLGLGDLQAWGVGAQRGTICCWPDAGVWQRVKTQRVVRRKNPLAGSLACGPAQCRLRGKSSREWEVREAASSAGWAGRAGACLHSRSASELVPAHASDKACGTAQHAQTGHPILMPHTKGDPLHEPHAAINPGPGLLTLPALPAGALRLALTCWGWGSTRSTSSQKSLQGNRGPFGSHQVPVSDSTTSAQDLPAPANNKRH